MKGERLQAKNPTALMKDTHIPECRKDIYDYANHGVYAALEENNWDNNIFKSQVK